MVKIIQAAAAVIFDPNTDSFFVGQRSKFEKVPLKWEFIGGKVEKGESLKEALEREVKEEIGKKVRAGKLIYQTSYDYGEKIGNFEIYFFECDSFEGEPRYSKHVFEKCAWVKRADLPSLDWVEGDWEFANKLASGIK